MAKRKLNEHERETVPEILVVFNILPPAYQKALLNMGRTLAIQGTEEENKR